MNLLLKNAKVLKENNHFEIVDLYIENNLIKKISPNLNLSADKILDLKNKLTLPGFIDVHVHLREPGFEFKETIKSGTLAAARGGYTMVCCMPNTNPTMDNEVVLDLVNNKIQTDAVIKVKPIAAITVGRKGEVICDFKKLKEKNILGFSDDGDGVQSELIMKAAMVKAREVNLPIMAHCEDCALMNKGAMHDGKFASRHNIKPISSASEYVHVMRDVKLAEETKCHYHVCHISTKESLAYVKAAKNKGVHVTCEVTPHHILLCDDDIPEVDCDFKMNPPLRENSDREAIIKALKDGTIDMIATDHAPHTQEEKSREIHCAPFGVVGLETCFPLLYTHLVLKNILTLSELVNLMTIKPASTFNLSVGRLIEGVEADLTVIDEENAKIVDPNKFLSMGKNTPFKKWNLKGWPILTISRGKIVYQNGDNI